VIYFRNDNVTIKMSRSPDTLLHSRRAPKKNLQRSSSPPFRTCTSRLHGVVRLSDRPNLPCFRLSIPRHRPLRCATAARHSLWQLRLPRRGGTLRVRYAASRPTDCSCHRTRPPVPRPPLPSSSACSTSVATPPSPLYLSPYPSPRLGHAAKRGGHRWLGQGQA
jgi:hypothetical protein